MVTGNRVESGLAATLQRFLKRAQKEIGLRGNVTVLLTTNNDMRQLNRRFRNKDRATDVLSFPSAGPSPETGVGDIAISRQIAREQARRFGHSVEEELKILLLHGLLHLAGYDHESDHGEMRRKERALSAKLGLPAPLTQRGAASRAES